MKTFRIRSTSDLPEVAEAILDARAGRTVIAFRGEMGAGKTTLIRAVCDRLGVTDTVTSPTYAIVNEYHGDGTPPVYNFDFYRIERPEKIESLLPDDAMNVRIDVPDEDERVISID